ncbi:restriction endonuclease subunit S [Methylomonas sp. MED-D]|uniref:restriction endonuclease subunit S n=1 Tax=Methylomonas sp. MED-D TaxID=3418768 RepID=UPI003D01D7D3
MSEHPNGWIVVALGDLCSKPQYGFTTKSTVEGTVKYLRTTDLTSGKINWDKVPFCITEPDDERYQLEDNDIVISRAGSVGFHCLVKQPPAQTVFASYLIRFKPDKAIFPEYLSLFLRSRDYWEQLKSKAVGVAVQNVNATSLSELVVPVAPLNEQIRIADKLDSVLAKVDAAQARLEKIPALLKRFRQSVLAAATSGELTREWREQSRLYEEKNSAHEVINLIQTRKLAWINENNQHNEVSRVKKRVHAFLANGDIETTDLPDNWAWAKLEDVVLMVVDCHNKTAPYVDNGIALVRTTNIRDGRFIWEDLRYVSEETYQYWSKRCLPEPGDVVFTREAPMGEAAIIPEGAKICLGQRTMLFRSIEDQFSAKFLLIALMDPRFRERSENIAVGTGVKHYRVGDVSELNVPVPPVEEQTEIVRRVESLFAQADAVEKQYRAAKQRLDRLSQSLLVKAFRGELVPQDPSDEPAAELLKRIQAERHPHAADKPKRKTAKRSHQNNAF